MGLSFAMLVSGCAEPSATVGLRLMAGDTNQADSPNYNLLQQSDIVELELLVEGPALPATPFSKGCPSQTARLRFQACLWAMTIVYRFLGLVWVAE